MLSQTGGAFLETMICFQLSKDPCGFVGRRSEPLKGGAQKGLEEKELFEYPVVK